MATAREGIAVFGTLAGLTGCQLVPEPRLYFLDPDPFSPNIDITGNGSSDARREAYTVVAVNNLTIFFRALIWYDVARESSSLRKYLPSCFGSRNGQSYRVSFKLYQAIDLIEESRRKYLAQNWNWKPGKDLPSETWPPNATSEEKGMLRRIDDVLREDERHNLSPRHPSKKAVGNLPNKARA